MKIAMPYKNGKINSVFGASKEFIILETDNLVIKNKKVIANQAEDYPGGLPQQLKDEGAEIIIAGGLGRPMHETLLYEGFEVIAGATGEVEKIALDYLKGDLITQPSKCASGGHDEDDDEED